MINRKNKVRDRQIKEIKEALHLGYYEKNRNPE